MRASLLVTGLISATFCLAVAGPGVQVLAQQATPPQSGTQEPDASSQPQKKPADKKHKAHAASSSQPSSSQSSSSSSTTPPAGNSLPAAPAPAASSKPSQSSSQPASKPSAAQENPFPEALSEAAAKDAGDAQESPASPTAQPPSGKRSAADENPFPEGVSKQAAGKAGQGSAPASGAPTPPAGYSSSQSSALMSAGGGSGPDNVADPTRAKKDTQVGDFYFAQGDWKGAYQRYIDATLNDPNNVDAIFGLAETEQKLKQYSEAQRNYMLYLAILPNGPKAKQSLRALKSLANK